ncbi:MAG: ABC transporter permease [Acidobacteria bacterium]|nr:ABC transporter permease [Acidobacteriota bacterium]
MKYVERRLLHSVFLLLGVSLLCFLFTDLAPGTYVDEIKLNPQISSETIAALKAQYGLDRPLPVRYFRWVKSVVKGEWGYSFAYNLPVRSLLPARARNTLILAGAAVALAWLIAIPLGIWCAVRAGGWADRLCLGGTSLLLAVPEIVLALVFLFLAVKTRAFPAGGMHALGYEQWSFWAQTGDLLRHLVLPVATLVLASLPVLVRHVRASMREALQSPFLDAARGYGIRPLRLLLFYALPAAANPLISLFGFSIGGLLSASLLVEAIVGWPGLGPFLLEATVARDLYVVVGVVMASTFFMISGNLLADFLLLLVDPRIRSGAA